MKDKAGQKRDKAGHVPNCPSDKAGQDGTLSYRSVPLSRLSQKLATIYCLDELYGFANRRAVLGVDLPKWTDDERRMILARKYELERKTKR